MSLFLEHSTEELFGYPDGLSDQLINEDQAQKIKAVIARLEKAKTQGDIEAIIKMLRALVI